MRWRFWRRDTGGPTRWWRVELGRRQLALIRKRVEFELYRRRLELTQKVAEPEDYEATRVLELRLSALDNARDDLNRTPAKKPDWVDRLVMRLWEWASRERFDFDYQVPKHKRRKK